MNTIKMTSNLFHSLPSGGVDECLHGLEEVRKAFTESAIDLLGHECERALDHVSTIPRLYRRTNKEVSEGIGRGDGREQGGESGGNREGRVEGTGRGEWREQGGESGGNREGRVEGTGKGDKCAGVGCSKMSLLIEVVSSMSLKLICSCRSHPSPLCM